MPTRFIGKNIRKMVVRPIKNSMKHTSAPKVTEPVANVAENTDAPKETKEKKENKRIKKNTEMINTEKLNKVEEIAGINMPNANIKYEKKDKGLFERTENCTVLLTEDNKMLLND